MNMIQSGNSGFWMCLLSILLLVSCDSEEIPQCLRKAGERVEQEVVLPAFDQIIVYDRINLFIEQGKQQVVIRAGKNFIEEVSLEVEDRRLIIKSTEKCNLFRDYNTTDVVVRVPDLTWLQNAGNTSIRSLGPLHFPKIWLRSINQEEIKGVYTNGDFELELISEEIRITGDDFSNFFLSGSTDLLDLFIAAGDGRVEAGDLQAEVVDFQHRGTNKLIVNPEKLLKGEIRSTGDVISINRPPEVRVESYYTGKLIFDLEQD